MDIIIRNGVIQKKESERIFNIKNEEGLLKKDFSEYRKDIPGPYYDFQRNHICVPRKHDQIINFHGPQIINRIKLQITDNYSKKHRYCCICHRIMKPNPSFSAKRKVFYDEDIFKPKEDQMDKLGKSFKKVKFNDKITDKNINQIEQDILSLRVNFNQNSKLIDLANKLVKYTKKNNFETIQKQYNLKQTKTIDFFYKIVYKLTKEPYYYPISIKETKILWPWQLTDYQKFRLNNPDYKKSCIFSHNCNNKITTNYVMIE